MTPIFSIPIFSQVSDWDFLPINLMGPDFENFLNLDDWHAKPVAGRNLFGGIDGIRGIAILLVVAAHSVPFLYMDTTLKRCLCVISTNGTLGVWLFFVLSGFLISLPFFKQLEKQGDCCPPGYALRRAAKVIPPLYVSITVVTLSIVSHNHSWLPLRSALETMAFFEIFKIPIPVISPIYWSLAAEVTFYALLPLLFFTLRAPLKTRPWLIPLFLVGLSTGVWVGVCGNPGIIATQPFIRDVLLSFIFFGWGAAFSCFHLAYSRTPFKKSGLFVWTGLIGLIACCGIGAHYWLRHKAYIAGPYSGWIFRNAVASSAFLMLFTIYDPRAAAVRLLSNPLLTLTGLISYEWYLFHVIFLGFSNMITGEDLHGSYPKLMVRIFFTFPVAFTFSALFYRNFSLPILRWAHQTRSH